MSNPFRLLGVKNAELLAGLSRLVQRSNELTAEVLAHLAELEERRLHLQLGFPSLFAYCVESLGLSEGSAGRRVAAARACRRFPEAFELVARGDLHLSALCGLAPHLNPHNATELFSACCRKTRRQVDELLAARLPKPDVRDQIRRLPIRGGAAAAADNDLQHSGTTHTREEASAEASVAGGKHEGRLLESAQIAQERSSTTTGESEAIEQPAAAAFSGSDGGIDASINLHRQFVPPPPPRRREIEALSADRFGVHFTADAELRELIERARALASHRLPKNDLSSLMRLVLASFVKHEEGRRFAVGRRPRSTKPLATRDQVSAPALAPSVTTPPATTPPATTPPGGARQSIAPTRGKTAPDGSRPSGEPRIAARFAKRSKRSRYIPAAVRRAVYLRDHARCSFVSEDGRRCEARALLELDHVKPWARLGGAGLDNIRLRCRAHNQMHARESFGTGHIDAKITARGCGSVRPSGES
jgi:hypothetical protein